jgi:hypothetical protein
MKGERLTFDVLGIVRARAMFLWGQMPLIPASMVGVRAREAKRFQQSLEA